MASRWRRRSRATRGDARRPALDEIRHAQISFSLAGGAIGPGPCPAFAELRAHRSLAELAEETYLDGCIGETLAAGGSDVRARVARAALERAAPRSELERWVDANVIVPCTGALLSDAA